MRNTYTRTVLHSLLGLILLATAVACGSDSPNDKNVAVNLSLIVDGRQANDRPPLSRFFAWIDRWFPGVTPVWAQSVSEIASIQVQISGPGIATPATTTVPVSNPTSGQVIPVSIQAPVGPNRTIAVSAFNAQSPPVKIFGGTLTGVNLTPGAPINREITLVRLFTVTVEKQGNGSGTVTSTPAGIACDPTCSSQSGQFEQGTSVILNAAAALGSSFAGWAGDCSGFNSCTVSGQARAIARFDVPVSTNHLHVSVEGTGSGTVNSSPSGISCGTSCDADYATGTLVTLTASPAEGSTFTSWSGGGCSLVAPSCTVAMNVDQTVTAIFTAIVPPPMSALTVQKSGSGVGTVTSAPSGINCGNDCSESFPTNFTVTLTATPAPGSTFVGWSGDCSGTSCAVTMDTNRTVSAQFDLAPQFVTLTVNKSGSGTGTVTSNDGAIVCDPSCQSTQFTYLVGTVVILHAEASEGSTFDEWQGGPCNNQSGDCELTMNMDRTAEANFDANN